MPFLALVGRPRQRGAARAAPPPVGVDRASPSGSRSARRGSPTSGGPRDRAPSRRTSSPTWSAAPRGPSGSAPLRRLPADPAEVLPADHPARPPRALARLRRPGRCEAAEEPSWPPGSSCRWSSTASRPSGRRGSSSPSCPRSPCAPATRSSTLVPRVTALLTSRAGPDRRGRRRARLLAGTRRSSRGTPTPSSSGTRPTIKALAPAGEPVPYLGSHYWATANPLPLLRGAGAGALEPLRPRGGRGRAAPPRPPPPGDPAPAPGARWRLDPPREVVLEGRDWVLLRVGGAGGGSGG